MNQVRRGLLYEIEKIIESKCEIEYIPEKERAAPDVGEVWNGCFASFEIYEMANEIVEAMEQVLKTNAFKLLDKEE